MKVVGRDKLVAFCVAFPDARRWIESWLAEVEAAGWRTPHDLKAMYASASLLGRSVVIFNVKGNRYRMKATVAYGTGVVVIQWIGTHAEYDARNARR